MTRQIQSALAWIGVDVGRGAVPAERAAAAPPRARRGAARGGQGLPLLLHPRGAGRPARRGAEAGRRLPLPAHLPAASRREEIEARLAAGKPFAVRFRMPDEHIPSPTSCAATWTSRRTRSTTSSSCARTATPTYHMSVVVDDIDMRITHVIRGEDHLSNTPKHVPLFRALGGEVPTFGHLPLILGPDKKRLSKRYGATSVEEFRNEGVLPQALYNFLALLGWNPGDDREILSRDEMIGLFAVDRLNASAAVFDREKLLWMNSQYLSQASTVEGLLPHLEPFLEPAGLTDADPAPPGAAVELHRSRARTLKELAELVAPYFARESPTTRRPPPSS